MTKIIAVGNQKGGTGKTATVYALAEVLTLKYNQRVLMVDVDPQASLTYATGINTSTRATLPDVLKGDATIGQAVHTLESGVMIVPSGIELSNVELGLVSHKQRATVLQKALQSAESAVDVIILDLPPSLGLLTINGLTACQGIIIPSRPTLLDVAGLSLFLETVDKAKVLNPGLEVLGVLFTFRIRHIISMGKIIKQLKGLHVFKSRIGQSIRVAESHGGSVVTRFPSNPRAGEYIKFASEVYKWIK